MVFEQRCRKRWQAVVEGVGWSAGMRGRAGLRLVWGVGLVLGREMEGLAAEAVRVWAFGVEEGDQGGTNRACSWPRWRGGTGREDKVRGSCGGELYFDLCCVMSWLSSGNLARCCRVAGMRWLA